MARHFGKLVSFTLTPLDLSFYDINMRRVVEAGDLEIMVGGSSDAVLSKTVQIDKTMPMGPSVTRSFGNL